MTELAKTPVPDRAEYEAYFPSAYSLSQYTSPVSDFDGVKFEKPYTGGKHRILVIGTDERYLETQNGKLFSTGNHPVETLLPMLHMHKAGFPIDIATLSGNSVKFEMWAMPGEDKAVGELFQEYLPQIRAPKKLSDIIDQVTAKDSPYIGVFIPGGHGAFNDLPESREIQRVLNWALENDRFIITLCHGPAALVAAGIDKPEADFPLKGYSLCVFPDVLDEGANLDIGYMPGRLKWLVAERLEKLGMKLMNTGPKLGMVHKDRRLLTGDSPMAANKLGILAADELLKAVA